ncbi:uncharacterized protein LODBEIA_P60330 [Lodderomyces beijingensis]|uniref:XPA C-terminal domain-containing protein n=1 Tax=Lodderomyces beijingensis TaxID=1775926 RepID=A0ABP0ZV29_9ASCO
MSQANVSDEQRKRIEANRARTLERLQRKKNPQASPLGKTQASASTSATAPASTNSSSPKRPLCQILDGPSTTFKTRFLEFDPDGSVKKARTLEQVEKVEQNRLRAIEIQKRKREEKSKAGTNPTSTTTTTGNESNVTSASTNVDLDKIRLNKNQVDYTFDSAKSSATGSKYQAPPINRKDYIEFDFATMQDTRGGFIEDETRKRQDEETLAEWKEKQRELERVKNAPPPADLDHLPRCFECGSMDIDLNLFTNFRKVRACRPCVKKLPEKYSLLVKTECKEDYLLTEPELQDVALLPRIEKPNPHGYSKMQLFLRFQIEEYAWKKWGSPQGLDEEWERRESNRIKRREKKYQDALKEMRKKTRAEEYTRKLRDGKDLSDRHVHDWSAPVSIGERLLKKRCIDCGIEIEEVMI